MRSGAKCIRRVSRTTEMVHRLMAKAQRNRANSAKDGLTDGKSVPENAWQTLLHFLWPPHGFRLLALVGLGIGLVMAAAWASLPDDWKTRLLDSLADRRPNPVGYYPGVELERIRVTVDLSNWTPEAPVEEWLVEATCYRTREEAVYLARRIASSADEAPKVYSELPARIVNAPLNSRRPNMKNYDVLLDIRDKPINALFSAAFRSIRHGGIVDPKAEWVGNLISQPTRECDFGIVFPKNHPGRAFTYRMYPFFDKTTARPVAPAPEEVSISPSAEAAESIRWTIKSPHLNDAYEIHWEWGPR